MLFFLKRSLGNFYICIKYLRNVYIYICTYLCTEYIIYELRALFLFCFTLGKTSKVFLNETKRRYWLTRKTITLARTVFSFLRTSILNLKLVESIFYIFIVNSYFLSKIIEYRCATQMCDKGVSLFFKLIDMKNTVASYDWFLKLLLKRVVRSLDVIFDFVMYTVIRI